MSTENSNINPNQIGGLWESVSSKGNTYLRGQIVVQPDWKPGDKIKIFAFRNTKKQEGDKTPDYRINKEVPREQWERQQNQNTSVPAPEQPQQAPPPRPPVNNQRGQARPRPARPNPTPAPNTASDTV